MIDKDILEQLRSDFGSALQENIRLSYFATMNVGGLCDALITAYSADDLANIVSRLWQLNLPVKVLGGGSNLLISDKGVSDIIVINHAHNIKVICHDDLFKVRAESGALMVTLGKQLALRGLSGMEWAATIPGTVGGAVYGNAGAFNGETCQSLISADVLDRDSGRSEWLCEQLQYSYRASIIKRKSQEAVILSALFRVEKGNKQEIERNIEIFRQKRGKNQPPGASVGSVFRNPPGDKAGRLIEAAGLKGKRIGGAIISPHHANFIINDSNATAQNVLDLLVLARNSVKDLFGIELIPEIEVIGEWENLPDFLRSTQTEETVN